MIFMGTLTHGANNRSVPLSFLNPVSSLIPVEFFFLKSALR
jgi:hypothetical protein